MIFHENRLPADDSHEIPYLISFRKLGEKSQYLSSAAVVIGALRVKIASLIAESPIYSYQVKDRVADTLECFMSKYIVSKKIALSL